MIRRPPRSTLDRSSAASDVYKRQLYYNLIIALGICVKLGNAGITPVYRFHPELTILPLSLIHISEPTRPY